jgi:hypothetical protein
VVCRNIIGLENWGGFGKAIFGKTEYKIIEQIINKNIRN